MTDDRQSADKSIKTILVEILERLANNYFGEEGSPRLNVEQRSFCSIIGIFVFGVLLLSLGDGSTFPMERFTRVAEFIVSAFDLRVNSSFILIIIVLMLSLGISGLLSVMIAASIKRGTPLLFFFFGFLLSAFLVSVASGV